MNILFYSTYHFNTEVFGPYLETIQEHINKGDEVYFINCNSDLSSCQTNPNHNLLHCNACINFRKNGLACINGKVQYINLGEIINTKDLEQKITYKPFQQVDDMKKYTYQAFDIGMAVLSSIISITRNPIPDLVQYQSLVHNQFMASLQVYEAIKRIIQEKKIDEVYVFNARFATLRACLRACEQMQTQCNVLEEGKDREHYSIFENTMPHSVSYYENAIEEKWQNGDENKRERAMQYYIRRSNQQIDRVSAFTSNQTKGLLPSNWDSSKHNIVIFNSSEDEFAAIGDDWKPPIYSTQSEAIQKIANDLKPYSDIHIYLRIHPNLNGVLNQSIIDFLKIRQQNFTIILADEKISTYDLMKNANKVLTFGSSVGIEAAAFNIPSILAGITFYRNLQSTYNPATHEELLQMLLNKNLKPKSNEGALKYAYFLNDFGIPYKHFQRKDTFTATMNGKSFTLSFPYNIIRKLGREIRLRNEQKQKQKNIAIIKKIAQ